MDAVARKIQEALSLSVLSQAAKHLHSVTLCVSRRAGRIHSGIPCGLPSAASTAAASSSPIQPARVAPSSGLRCRIQRSLYPRSQRTGANPRSLGESNDNRLLVSSHHSVPELVSAGEVCPTMVQVLHDALEKDCSHRNCLRSRSRATDMFPLHNSIDISTCFWVVHNGG
jgi:hypothetical protein